MKMHLIYRTYNALFIAAILFATLFISGCSGGGGTEVGNPSKTYNSWDELEDYIKGQFSETVLASSLYSANRLPTAGAGLEDVSASSSVVDGYSQTTVQEVGVDESDKVKTDGTYLYVADDHAVHIVKAVPSDSMEVLSPIDVNGTVDSLYLYNDLLIILYTPSLGGGSIWDGTDRVGVALIGVPYWIPVKAQTGVLIMDVSDPSSPKWIKDVIIDGWLVSSRLTNSRLHIIQQFMPDLPPLQLTYNGTTAGMAEVIAANDRALESVTIDDLIPSYEILDEQGDSSSGGRLIVPEDFYRPDEPAGGSIVSIVTFNLADMSEGFKSVGLIADAHTVYASTRALYIAATQWNYGAVPVDLNSQYYRTVLYKFGLGEDVTLEGTGEVSGKILNQFSLGEYGYEGEDVLRIATNNGAWGTDSRNYVYCLKIIGDRLEIIGELEVEEAAGEDIYSARFIGTRGFLVTFVKVDPLFTLDLSDPSEPEVVGELKVPGYSDYIHPMGEDHLITIGKDTILENGITWYQGLQLSIFDISNFADPILLHKELIGNRGTTSEALSNHKAFTFWAEDEDSNLLAIPVDLYEYQGEPDYPYSYGTHTFTGLYVYRVTVENGFEYLGRISTAPETGETYYYGSSWLRGLFIEQDVEKDVYAVNDEAVRSADIDDIGTVYTIFFDSE